MADHWLFDAPLAPDLKADLYFHHKPGAPPNGDDEGWEDEIEILHVSPIGVVGPIDEASLKKLAYHWLNDSGGYEACCRKATNGAWE